MTGVWNDEEARRNTELTRGTRLMTIEDAPYRLTSKGLVRNRSSRFAPVKRRFRDLRRNIAASFRTYLWHPVLDRTRSLRHAMGLKKDVVPKALRSKERRHWMDQ